MTFFGLGYEHSIVNLFLVPTGMLLEAPVRFDVWLVWNQLPATLGNIAGGAVRTGLALVWSYGRR
ncbi:MAG: formate/nitrite transporter family protein [Thermomicrobium sp.]|nr:formate/nitrite transporter family protein [Thermomicrobium sp.]